jgi:hypothetical protein
MTSNRREITSAGVDPPASSDEWDHGFVVQMESALAVLSCPVHRLAIFVYAEAWFALCFSRTPVSPESDIRLARAWGLSRLGSSRLDRTLLIRPNRGNAA